MLDDGYIFFGCKNSLKYLKDNYPNCGTRDKILTQDYQQQQIDFKNYRTIMIGIEKYVYFCRAALFYSL